MNTSANIDLHCHSTASDGLLSPRDLVLPGRNDHPWVHGLTRRYYRSLLRNGVRIWEWRGEMMHAKTSIIDGRWIRVGSTDFNPFGVAINYELDAFVEDVKVAAAAEAMFLRELEQSHEVRGVLTP